MIFQDITKYERLLTAEEIAEFFSSNIATIMQWIHKGDLAAIKVNRTYRITVEEFNDFIERNKFKPGLELETTEIGS